MATATARLSSTTGVGVKVESRLYGCQSMTGELQRVLVRGPRAEDLPGWRMCGWRAEPDAAGITAEHDAFCELLAAAGAEVVLAESSAEGNPDAIFSSPTEPRTRQFLDRIIEAGRL